MSISALLDQSLTLQRPTVTSDASGGSVRAFNAILNNIPCAVSPASAAIAADYARRDMVVNYRIYTNLDLDSAVSGGVQLGDRLTDGSHYYLVKAVKRSANALVTAEVLFEIDCERINV